MSSMHASSFSLRPAAKAECGIIAQLYRISSEGVSDYIWSNLAEPGEDILDVGARRYAREDTPFSYQSCTLAIQDNQVAGMLVAFPMSSGDEADDEELDPVLEPYRLLEEDNSYYICGMALFPEFRNQGIGSRFLQQAESEAINSGLDKLSLIVYALNHGAVRLYERNGFHEVARQPIVPYPLIRCTGDAVLMVKHL